MPEGRGRGGPEGGADNNVVDDMVKTLMAFDTNGDGKLSKDELPERFQGIFSRGGRSGALLPGLRGVGAIVGDSFR